MIRKLKFRFVLLAMTALLVLLTSIVAAMNILNYNSVIAEADTTLELISQNQGTFPDIAAIPKPRFPGFITMETPYESRFFSVLVGKGGDVLMADTARISAIDGKTAVDYAAKAMEVGKRNGFIDHYRFVRVEEGFATRIVFLDCGRRLYACQVFLASSVGMSLLGYVLFFGVILYFSGRIMRPVAESYEKQKRFITDAGHEIKTPLAIIKADADVLEMEYGENEWLDGIQVQIRRLTALTTDLVYLSRMEEAQGNLPMIEFPFSDVVEETAQSFQVLAHTGNKQFTWDVEPMLSYVGNEKAIRLLVNVLMDNAMKYSPENGIITLTAARVGRYLCISAYNTTRDPVEQDQLTRLFERFYRTDSSRNSATGGYGIGLSIAQAIVNAHKGRISAASADGWSLEINIQLPV